MRKEAADLQNESKTERMQEEKTLVPWCRTTTKHLTLTVLRGQDFSQIMSNK